MVPKSLFQMVAKWLVIGALLGTGFAMAQAEPNMNQIYSTAQAGKLDDAQTMIQQVLVSHPKSAKAYFVQAELYSRQGKLDRARDSLATAEKFSPGLAFAKPDAVQALRSQLVGKPAAKHVASPSVSYAVPQSPAKSSSSWVLPLLLAGCVIVGGYFIFRRRNPEPYAQQPVYANQSGLNGPQNFGMVAGGMQPAYPQQGGTGLGGRIMGGVATGLAVGAGVVAAEAIGRNLMGGYNSAPADQLDNLSSNDYQPINNNPDMGGAGFGIKDTSSWDDGGGADMGGGGDWDN
jgi:tetratricopeptide (TPR) repeat protein